MLNPTAVAKEHVEWPAIPDEIKETHTELGKGQTITGRIVNTSGRPSAHEVVFARQGDEHGIAITSQHGVFQFTVAPGKKGKPGEPDEPCEPVHIGVRGNTYLAPADLASFDIVVAD